MRAYRTMYTEVSFLTCRYVSLHHKEILVIELYINSIILCPWVSSNPMNKCIYSQISNSHKKAIWIWISISIWIWTLLYNTYLFYLSDQKIIAIATAIAIAIIAIAIAIIAIIAIAIAIAMIPIGMIMEMATEMVMEMVKFNIYHSFNYASMLSSWSNLVRKTFSVREAQKHAVGHGVVGRTTEHQRSY